MLKHRWQTAYFDLASRRQRFALRQGGGLVEGSQAVKFSKVLAEVTWLLLCERRLTYRRIKREYNLDAAAVEDLRHELIQVKGCAADQDGEFLTWAGTTENAQSPSAQSDGSRISALRPLALPEVASPKNELVNAIEPAVVSPLTDPPEAILPTSDAERRPLTVLFCDLADSTALSTRLDPEDLQDVIRTYQETCARHIQEYEGFVAKYMGDGILVYFGYPKSLERNAERAVRSALDIVAAMVGLNQTLGQDKGIEIAVRLGIATGMVMVGEIVGQGMAQERTVIGEAPNMAARLQALAGRNGIVVSRLTRELAGDAFDYEDLGSHELKGITGLVQTWGVTRLHDDTGVAHGDDHDVITAPVLVGRDEEIGLLRRAWQSTKDEGRGQVVILSGEAGIGKSSLIDRLKAEVRTEGRPQLTMRCSPYHTNSALYPVIEHFRRLSRWQPEDDAASRLAKLEAMLCHYTQPLSESVPLMASLLSLEVPEDCYLALALSPQQQKQQTQDMITGITMEVAENQPFLQLWEDLHWADPSTLELIALLIEQAPTVSLLMVATARPEFVPPWPARSHITPITLNRLERPHSEALVARIAGVRPLPEEVVDHITTKTDGVPLYVEELTKTILASDILRDTGKSYELTGPLTSLSIPETLQESLMARLDRLPQVRELAQLGSVLGREFAYEMISGLSNIGDTVLKEGLGQLVDAELLYQRGRPPTAKYIFKHALVKDAAYGSLLRRPRQQYHRQVAELLEKHFPETVEANPELLAHHYSEADVVDRAVDYWQLAGQRAIERSANAEAIAHLNFGVSVIRAAPVSDDLALRELKLQTMLAGPLIATKGYSDPETVAVFKHAHALSNQVNDPTLMFPVLYQQWVFNLINHSGARMPETLRIARQFLEMAEAQQATLPKVLGHRITATSQYSLGEFSQAKTGFETAISYYDEEQHRDSTFEFGQNPKSASLAFLGNTLHILGYPDQAKKMETAALDHAEEMEHAYTTGYVRCFGDFCNAFFRRDIDDAERSNASFIKLADEQNFPLFNWFADVNAGWLLSKQGRHDEAIVTAQSGLENLRKAGILFLQPMVMGQTTEVLAAGGQPEKALGLLDAALEAVGRSEERFFEAELYRLKGEQLILADGPGAVEEAEKLFLQSLDIARNQQAKSWELRTATNLARMRVQQGKTDDAVDLLQAVYDWFTEGFDTPDLKEARALLDGLT